LTMTTTETRPLAHDDADEPAGQSNEMLAPPDRPARSGGRVARRLPYAFVAVALAVGYGFGHKTNTSAPAVKVAAPSQPAAVTADQINRALASMNGHVMSNDRGYSLLENGVQHNHGFELPMSAATRAELAREMDIARETALKFPTLADAEKGGLRRAGPFSPGLGLHMIAYGNYGGAGKAPMTDEQIRRPLAWIYDGTKPSSRVSGLFYSATVADPAGFAGPNDVWHQHTNICIKQVPGGIDAPLGADHDATVAQCNAVGGQLLAATGPLLHVWVVPGYEDSQGVFSHLNPAVTCNDGTYRTIADVTKIGSRLSVCADGTE
jgi:hypothetical protein